MGCFPFFDGANTGEPKAMKVVSNLSSNSALGDDEENIYGSELNSQNVSDTSTDSIRKNSFFSMSQRSTSNLRVFTFQELKSCTKGFSRSGRIGEGGFGCVYKGMIKSLEDPSVKVDVAVKQLGKRGLQASNSSQHLLLLFIILLLLRTFISLFWWYNFLTLRLRI